MSSTVMSPITCEEAIPAPQNLFVALDVEDSNLMFTLAQVGMTFEEAQAFIRMTHSETPCLNG